jgi:hypothetical protein
MFQAIRARTARFVCEYLRERRSAIHQAEMGVGIPRISRTTRDSVGGRVGATTRVLESAIMADSARLSGPTGPVRAASYPVDSYGTSHKLI